eukprot:CAMPEP_0194239510 /NCGR_PEP_ID=MMETSP0158-20130606/5950_1 /TAXON_ID=33649 /ORGANISM="Thalassionema nitzschioides, Strain L26-B" /LENGTH=90 /DNA_ID=CAMNT_0038973995 /DNA_START=13 /DNA_END=282 /DNA_ORIENTATION=+
MKYTALLLALTVLSGDAFAPNPSFRPALTQVSMSDGPNFKEVAENAQDAVKNFFDKATTEIPKFLQDVFNDESDKAMTEDKEDTMEMPSE